MCPNEGISKYHTFTMLVLGFAKTTLIYFIRYYIKVLECITYVEDLSKKFKSVGEAFEMEPCCFNLLSDTLAVFLC